MRALPSRKNIRPVTNDTRSNKRAQKLCALEANKDQRIARGYRCHCTIPPTARSMQMMDIIMLALGLAFFALTVGYAIACDHL
jgi:hypothetical protein